MGIPMTIWKHPVFYCIFPSVPMCATFRSVWFYSFGLPRFRENIEKGVFLFSVISRNRTSPCNMCCWNQTVLPEGILWYSYSLHFYVFTINLLNHVKSQEKTLLRVKSQENFLEIALPLPGWQKPPQIAPLALCEAPNLEPRITSGTCSTSK